MSQFSTSGKKMLRFVLPVLVLLLANCSSYDYSRKMVQQGNLLPSEKVERIKVGMSKEDVAILMGTSLLSPMFDQGRWDYAYTLKEGRQPTMVKHLSVYFKNNKVSLVEQR